MPAKPRKKAAPEQAPKAPRVFLEVDDQRLPFVHYQDWTIDDQMAVTAVLPGLLTPASAYDKFVASSHAGSANPHLFALMWWVAVRHSGERTGWPKVQLEIANADKLNVDVVEVDEDDESPDSPEG
jgi:hypothetical protein